MGHFGDNFYKQFTIYEHKTCNMEMTCNNIQTKSAINDAFELTK